MKKSFSFLGLVLMSTLLFLFSGVGFAGQKYKLGDIPLPKEIYMKYLKTRPPLEMAEVLPSSYDARGYNLVTSAKNQGNCGSCWAFATVGAMESHLLKQFGVGPENLSEQQQVSCNTANYGCDGGYSTAVRYWEAPPYPDKGPLDETVFPYEAKDTTDGIACYESDGAQMAYRITNFYTVPSTTSDFKTSLYNDGPSYWRYTVYSDFYTYWNTYNPGAVYVNQAGSNYEGGHAVLLIGWDDNKGAFLCKNSWGSGGPNGDGTFWIAYSGHYNDLGFGMANFTAVALETCAEDADCVDGNFCNGDETCGANGVCIPGEPVSCDNGLFCDGSEVCDEELDICVSSGNPCSPDTCVEDGDFCMLATCEDGYGICDVDENCYNCPSDCMSGSGGALSCNDLPQGVCFKDVCNGVCHPRKDQPECPDCAPSYCCGDGVCTSPEDSYNCAIDCGDPPSCGDGYCDDSEDKCSCPVDCGQPGLEVCTNGIDDDCDGLVDCEDIVDCGSDTFCSSNCLAKKDVCSNDSECCSGRCKNGQCR